MKVSLILKELTDACAHLAGKKYCFNRNDNKLPNLHDEVEKIIKPILQKWDMEYSSWNIRLVNPKPKDLEYKSIITLDIDFNNDKRSPYNRRGLLVAIRFNSVIEVTEDEQLSKMLNRIIAMQLEKEYEDLTKRQRELNDTLNEVNIKAIQTYSRLEVYKNKIK